MDIPCICPPVEGKPRHDKDTITLRERLDFRSSLAAQNAVLVLKSEDPDSSTADVLAALTETYLLSGVESWSVVGVDGKPVEPTKPAIRELLLTNLDAAMVVADAADDLYRDAVLDPLVRKASNSSPDTPTDEPTSPTWTSPEQNQNHSSPSLTTTTPMDDTETTSLSLAGASSSSPN
jgi:hypothetical protein